MSSLARALVASGGLAIALLVSHASAPLGAQERTSEQALIERLRQIEGQLGLGQGQPTAEPSSRAEELSRQVEVIQEQLRSGAASQDPALGEEEVRRLVHEGLGVDVLMAETVERDGSQVYALTVMNPPGDYNGAFMVRTLLVDGTTGDLLGEVPHTPRAAGTDLSPGAPAAGPDSSGPEIRRRTFR